MRAPAAKGTDRFSVSRFPETRARVRVGSHDLHLATHLSTGELCTRCYSIMNGYWNGGRMAPRYSVSSTSSP